MNKVMCFFIMIFNLFLTVGDKGDSYSQYINKSYVVMDATNNKVIEGSNISSVRSVASVSKIMTAIIAIEYGDLNKEVIIEKEDIKTYGSSIYLKEGDKLTLLDLVYGLMLRSGNDAAKAIARVVKKDEKDFVTLMNEKAHQLGMNNSKFTNPSGLDVEEMGNLSTSYDLALLMSYAIKNDTFLKISGSKEYKSEKGFWVNKNKLLRNYKKTIAGKTGFTYKAKRTLVTAARDDETTFVVVTLDCGNDFNFHKFLYERNFNKYETIKVLARGENYIEEYIVTCSNDINVTIEKNNASEYSIKHSIGNEESTIYLVKGSNVEEIAKCKVKKDEENRHRGFFKCLKKFFNRFKKMSI